MPANGRDKLTSKWVFLVYGLLLGAFIVLAVRFITYAPTETHYHANFAVYINGQQEPFKDPKYYQEVTLCSLHGSTPLSRAHMHDEVPGVIHVHDQAVTWGQFFENLGWGIGPNYLYDGSTLHVGDGSAQLNIELNGQNLTGLTDISDQVIQDKDRLLVSFGNIDPQTLSSEYKTVPTSAAQYDKQKDPSSCKGPEDVTLADRFKHLL